MPQGQSSEPASSEVPAAGEQTFGRAGLNNLSTEVDLAAPRLPSKSATPAEVEKVIRLLEPRCQAATLFPRLRAAATQWPDNGGYLGWGVGAGGGRNKRRGRPRKAWRGAAGAEANAEHHS